MTSRRDELSWRAAMAALEMGERAARSRPTATAALVDTGIRAESLGRSFLDTVTSLQRGRKVSHGHHENLISIWPSSTRRCAQQACKRRSASLSSGGSL